MSVKLKPVEQQVILITGASSGIGLITAQTAASLGAKVILVARNEEALNNAVADIILNGGEAIAAPADVGDFEAFREAAEKGAARFGRIDTWVNDAGVGMWSKVTEAHLEDEKRLFETNFWGVVNGSRLAVEYLRNSGGALINIGSVVSDVAIPPQGMYAASKHAVQGFTDSLRRELKNAEVPISVTLIKPAAIDTPFPQNARNYFEKEASLPPPVYDPSVVASAILFAATHPRRELHAGGGGRVMSMMQREVPGLMDFLLSTKSSFDKNFADRPEKDPQGALYESHIAGQVHGKASKDRLVHPFSTYNTVAQHPIISSGVVTLAIAGVVAYLLLKDDDKNETWSHRLGRYGEGVRESVSGFGERASGYVPDVSTYVPDVSKYTPDVGSLRDRVSEFGEDLVGRIASGASHLAGSASHLTKSAAELTRGAGSLLGGRKSSSWW